MSLVLGVGFGISWLAVHGVALRKRDREALSWSLAFDCVAGVLVAVGAYRSDVFSQWMQEDGWAEWGTVVAFLGAAAVQFHSLSKAGAEDRSSWLRRFDKLALLGVGAFCLFVAGEEISWGQRLFAIEPPEIFLEENYQQEINVHNVLKDRELLGFELESKNLVALIAILYGVLAPLLSRLGQFRALLAKAAPSLTLLPWFLAVAWAEVAYPTDLTGEAAELGLGLLFVADAVQRNVVRRCQGTGHFQWAAITVGAPLLLGALIQPTVERLVYGSDEQAQAQTLEELQLLAADLMQQARSGARLTQRRRVHKRVFTAARQAYFQIPAEGGYLQGKPTPANDPSRNARRDRRGYFLDPWQNPYWILYERRYRRIMLYSFGPNRRRDTDTRHTTTRLRASGDDIAVVLPLD